MVRSDKELLIQKDSEEDTGTRRRSFSDPDQPKSELRHDLDKGTYGGESLSGYVISVNSLIIQSQVVLPSLLRSRF